MMSERKDFSKDLFDYLWTKPHDHYSDIAAGGRSEYVFRIPKSEEKKFLDLYWCALVNDPMDCYAPSDFPFEAVRGHDEMKDGAYCAQFAGYDFDGFYEHGPRCDVKCIKHVKFYRALWYIDNWPRGHERVCCTEPSGDKAGYVVCVMEDDNGQDQQK